MTAFVEHLSKQVALSQPENISDSLNWVFLSNGHTEHNETLIFFGFDKNSPNPVAVAKAPRMPSYDTVVRLEYNCLMELCGLLGEAAQNYIPRPIAFLNIEGQPALIMPYLTGQSLLYTHLVNDRKSFLKLAIQAAQTLRQLVDQTVQPLQKDEAPGIDFYLKARKFKEMYALELDEIKAVDLLVGEFERVSSSAKYKVMMHGDYWHGNLIRNLQNNNLIIIDWQYGRWHVDISQDVYLFLLAGALATSHSADEETRAKITAQKLVSWREDIIPAYLSAFGVPQFYSLLSPRLGFLMCCIDKATRASIELGFNRELDLVWRYLFKQLLNWID